MDKSYIFLDLEAVNRPYMAEIRHALERVALSGRYIGGGEVDALEAELAAATGTRFAIGTGNGLDALRIILRAYVELGCLSAGDEVVVPANTYIASVLAISDAGLTPVPADVDASTSLMTAETVAAVLTPRTRAIMPVHLYGRVCWSEALRELADSHQLKVIEDNAQAIGARAAVAGRGGCHRAGALGDAAAFSFYPTKNIGALGDAGAITTDDAELAAAARAIANYGSDRRYHNIYKGVNSRLDPLQAAVLRVKLPHAGRENARRRAVADTYFDCIKNPAVELPAPAAPDECVWHQFVVRTAHRDAFREYLLHHGVQTDVNYPVPVHLQPCYAGELSGTKAPEAELQSRTLVCLPVSACTSVSDAREISEIINSYRP